MLIACALENALFFAFIASLHSGSLTFLPSLVSDITSRISVESRRSHGSIATLMDPFYHHCLCSWAVYHQVQSCHRSTKCQRDQITRGPDKRKRTVRWVRYSRQEK